MIEIYSTMELNSKHRGNPSVSKLLAALSCMLR